MNCQECDFYETLRDNYKSAKASLFYINFNIGHYFYVCEDHKMPNSYEEMGYILVNEEQFKKSLLLI
jgi:hypothetical protein